MAELIRVWLAFFHSAMTLNALSANARATASPVSCARRETSFTAFSTPKTSKGVSAKAGSLKATQAKTNAETHVATAERPPPRRSKMGILTDRGVGSNVIGGTPSSIGRQGRRHQPAAIAKRGSSKPLRLLHKRSSSRASAGSTTGNPSAGSSCFPPRLRPRKSVGAGAQGLWSGFMQRQTRSTIALRINPLRQFCYPTWDELGDKLGLAGARALANHRGPPANRPRASAQMQASVEFAL